MYQKLEGRASEAHPPRRGLPAAVLVAALTPIGCAWLEQRGSLPVVLRDRWVAWAVLSAGLLGLSAFLWRKTRGRAARSIVATAWLASAIGATTAIASIERLYELPSASSALVGRSFANDLFPNELGTPTPLLDATKPTLVIWFRGAWCPYCRKQLEDIGKEASAYDGRIRVVGITADPSELADLKRQIQLPFPLLSDGIGKMMAQCELMHCVAIIGRDGRVQWAITAGNWRSDITPRALLQATLRAR